MDQPDPPPRQFGLKPKEFEKVNAPTSQEPTPPIRVEDILQQNLTVHETVKPLELDLETKMSRRTRDYLFLLIGGDVLILIGMFFTAGDPVLRILGFSALGFYSVGITAFCFLIMDRY